MSAAILRAFLEGASMASLGEITDSNVEPIIREELLRLGRDTTSPAAEPESAGSR